MNMDTGIGLLIPFVGTSAGAACVFFMKKALSRGVQRALTGFASGVMVAASIWSLLIPAMQQAEPMGKLSFLPAMIGFWCGILFLLLLDSVLPHLHMNANQVEGPKSRLARTTMMVLAVTLHNIPEGMAVGVVYAGFLSGSAEITAGGALALSLGIAIQNFPEGAIISMPLHAEGKGKGRAFLDGVLSGAVEPVAALLTILLSSLIVPAMPCLLSFAAGAMMYVVVEELIPEMSEGEHSNVGVLMFAAGFTLMMALDVALGLQQHGKSEPEAFKIISEAMWAALTPKTYQKMARLSFFLTAMKKILPFGFRHGSGAGWRYTWHLDEDPKNRFHFECRECLYWHIFHERNLMKLGVMFCHSDIINFGSLRRWENGTPPGF